MLFSLELVIVQNFFEKFQKMPFYQYQWNKQNQGGFANFTRTGNNSGILAFFDISLKGTFCETSDISKSTVTTVSSMLNP